MPLDIMPAPAALPGAAPPPGPAADAPPGGASVAGSAALLFGLLLAQTVGQAPPKAPPAAALPAGAAPAVKSTATVAETPPALTVRGKGEDKKKDKDKTPAEVLPVPATIGPLPAPPLPTQAAGLTTNANTGKVMDTVPAPGGELLSPRQITVPVEAVRVPTATSLPPLPHAPVPPTVPSQALAVPSQALVGAAPGVTGPAPGVQATAAGTAIVPPPAPVTPRPPAPTAAAAPHTPTVPAAPVSTTPEPSLPGVPAANSRVPSAPSPGKTPSVPPTAVAPASIAAAVAPPSLPKTAPAGTPPPAQPQPMGLQNGGAVADNQPGKNAGGKTAGLPPAPPIKEAARVAAPQSSVGKQAPAVQAVAEKVLPQDKPAASTGRTAHTADTAPTAPSPQAAPVAAPSQAATPMPPADRTQMLAQVTHSLETMAPKVGVRGGPQQVTLQLHPRDWGQLNVRVTMTPTVGADGKVSTQVMAHVIAEHPAVKAALETGQGELRHTLREAGLHLDRLTVTVQAPAAGAETNAGGSRQGSRSGEGWGGAQAPPFGTTAQGGSAFGGRHPAPSATLAQGQINRSAAQSPGRETEDRDVPVTTITGRVDTRA